MLEPDTTLVIMEMMDKKPQLVGPSFWILLGLEL